MFLNVLPTHLVIACPSPGHSVSVGDVQHLPSIYVLSIILASIILGGTLNNIPTVLLSTYFAWIYLRFLQTKPELALR